MPVRFRVLVALCLATLPLRALADDAPPKVTTPVRHLGANLGDDYFLANYKQLTSYWKLLESESPRLKVVSMGKTADGRDQLMGIVTSPANHAKLAKLQAIAKTMAKAEGTEAAAKALAAEGKAVVWIDGGLHASESLCIQANMETLYQFVSANDAETKRILDDVIILFVHANPDGHDLVADWYMREKDPRKRSLAGLPRLYQKYIGHDNNRDFFASTQPETENMNRVMYREWFPQIVYNHHQTGPAGTVLFCPPFRDPFNYNCDPLVISGIDAVGAAMMQRFLVEGKPGATTRSGARYSTWWNGGLRTTCYFHNMIGLLTETIGSPTPMTIPFNPSQQLPKADYLAPIAPQVWHFRQSVEYSVTANKAILDYASRNREHLLLNIWRMGKAAIDRGNRDSWTITPKDIEAARAGRGGAVARGEGRGGEGRGGRGGAGGGGRGAGGVAEFERLLHAKEKRDPRGYVIPVNQPDFLTATKFVNTLMETGVTVQKATDKFEVAGKWYDAGSYVVKAAQPFRAHVMDMFEPQDHPNDFAYPGGPPVAPYDMAGWTLAFQMGVKFDRVLDGFDGPFEEVTEFIKPKSYALNLGDKEEGYYFSHLTNDSYRAVNQLLKAGERVSRVTKSERPEGLGAFYVHKGKNTDKQVQSIASQLGIIFFSTPPLIKSQLANKSELAPLKPLRIGLWDRYGGSMPSGWTRWIFEQFEYPFSVVYVPELDKGNLNEKYDVLVFVDGAIPAKSANAAAPREGDGGDAAPGDRGQGPGWNEDRVPPEFKGQMGNVTAAKTIPQLKKFLEAGGTVVTIGTSTNLAQHVGLPVTSHLVEKDADGKDKAIPRDKFYVPASVLRVKVDNTLPIAWGMGTEADVTFAASPTFKITGPGVTPVARFEGKTPLRSGWALGQQYLDGGVAIAEAKVGKGRLVLCGPQVLFRAQPHGTFKFVFNALTGTGE
jgi:hypothetical protein